MVDSSKKYNFIAHFHKLFCLKNNHCRSARAEFFRQGLAWPARLKSRPGPIEKLKFSSEPGPARPEREIEISAQTQPGLK